MTGTAKTVVGVVLAGGQSRRMGGGDKALRTLAGKPMLAHVIERLASQVQCCVINANGDPVRFIPFGLPVVPDTFGEFPGPLAGILAGMRWTLAQVPDARWIVTVPGDSPLVPKDLVARLAAGLQPAGDTIALARSLGRVHPVVGLWPVKLADPLQSALVAGVRKVTAWTDQHGAIPVEFPSVRFGGVDVDPFFNANTPEDFETLTQYLGDGAP
jgi:molybdopterin-guanine dinucleotide biosynthesis protein A